MTRFLFLSIFYHDKYFFESIKSYFEERGDEFTFYTQRTLMKKIDDLNNHDVLLCGEIGKRKNNVSIHNKIITTVDYYIEKKRPVILLKTFLNQELFDFKCRKKEYIRVGIPSDFFLNYKHENFFKITNKAQIFNCGAICHYRHPKETSISRKDFYDKYNLNHDQKLIIFCWGRLNKININATESNINGISKYAEKILENLSKIKKICNSHGYQIIINHHIGTLRLFSQNKLFETKKKFKDFALLDKLDTYEAYKYADIAFSSVTSLAYELYLYDLATLDFGTGCYFFQWGSGITNKHSYNKELIDKYNGGRNLIFGKSVEFFELDDIDKLISEFIKNNEIGKYNIEQFPHLSDNPIWGNTYSLTIPEIYKIINEQLLCF